MAVQPATARVLKNHSITIAGTDYGPAVSTFRFVKSTSVQTIKGGTPTSVFTDMGAPTYTAEMTIFQDWETSGALVAYLLAHAGETVAVTYKPNAAGGPSFTAQIVLDAPDIGGDIDAWLQTSLTHGVVGRPTLVPAGS